MPSWSGTRRLIYLSIVVGFLLVVFSIPAYFILNRPGTCFDGIQNQDEEGIDCGGVCTLLCPSQTTNLLKHWERSFEGARTGFYDAVALIENRNVNAGIEGIGYSFKLYNEEGILIAERAGSAYVNPNERLVIFEGGIETKEQIPARTFFSFTETPVWKRVPTSRPEFIIRNKRVETDSLRDVVKATVVNQSLGDYERITVVALLFDDDDNAISVSKTEISRLSRNSSVEITFILPHNLPQAPARIDIVPRFNVVTQN